MTEHRQHPRKSIKLPVFFAQIGGGRVEAECRDISLGGMFIETAEPMPYGAEVMVYLSLPGLHAETAVKAVVRWTKRGAGMGVQFGMMGARETHALIALIQQGV